MFGYHPQFESAGGLCRRERSADAGRRAIHHSAVADRQFPQSRANLAAAACSTWGPMPPPRCESSAAARHRRSRRWPAAGIPKPASTWASRCRRGSRNGGVFSGHFSFEGEYQNRLLVVARSGSVIIERVFSPPADHRMEWRRRVRNVDEYRDIRARRYVRALPGGGDDGDCRRRSRELPSRSAERRPSAGRRSPRRSHLRNPAHQPV